MKSFLQVVAQDILTKHKDGLNDVAIVFPNKRASLFLNQALYEAAGKPLWSPAYVTISDLFRQHTKLTVPDQFLLVFKLYNLFCEVTGSDEPLDHFFSWGQLLLSDFDDIDKNMADANKLFINLEAWQEIKDFSFLTELQRTSLEQFFGKVMDQTAMQQRFNDIWKYLAIIYNKFREQLQSESLAYEGMLYRQVVETPDIQFRYKYYIFVGFNLLQKVEQSLFQRLKEEGKAEFYWDFDAYYLHNNEAGKYIANYLDRFPNELSRTRISASLNYDDIYNVMSLPKNISYISAPTENIQAHYVSEWLKQNNRIANGSQTAIVLGDERLLETVIHCLPDEVTNVNITTGYPLASSPISSFVNALIDLQLKGRANKKGVFRLKYINPVLRHPYAKYFSDDCPRLFVFLNEYKRYYPDIQLLTEGYDEVLVELFGDLQSTNGSLPLLSWISGILKHIGVGAREDNNPLMNESVFRMYTLINRLDDIMMPVTPEANMTLGNIEEQSGKQIVSTAILQRLITQVIQSTTIPFHGEPLLGIQIMGVLETRNLDFDHVLLLSCNEGNLPKRVNDASFIPHSLRKGYELTTVENKVAIYAYYFNALLQRALDVTMTYNNATNDTGKHEMSRFMLQYMVENADIQNIKHLTLLSGQSTALIQRLPIEKDKVVMGKLEKIDHLSPTAIGRYLRCPLQFYYYSICELKEDDNDDEEEMDSKAFGNIFHRAAQFIYDDLSQNCTHSISADSIATLRKDRVRLERHIDHAFADVLFNVKDGSFRPQYNGLQLLNKKVIRIYLDRLLRLDQQLAPIDILALEKSFYDSMTFQSAGREYAIQIGGWIDRLDKVTKNGQKVIRVVDYKTGTPLSTMPADIPEIFNPDNIDTKHSSYYLQAFLYAGIIRRSSEALKTVNKDAYPVSPALLFTRSTTKTDYDPTLVLGTKKNGYNTIEDIDDWYEEFMGHLKSLVSEIYNPEIVFSPTTDNKRCTNCPYNQICGL